MLDAKRRFSKNALLYDKYRPSYPRQLTDWILKTAVLPTHPTIVDIGCGTGISTRLFSHKGFNLIGIDPNSEMRNIAEKRGGAVYLRGEAAKTGLPSASCDLILVAQAFHWFDFGPTLKEFARILKPEGWCAAFWNNRQKTPFLRDYDALIRDYSSDYAKIQRPSDVIKNLKNAKEVKSVEEFQFPGRKKFSLKELKGYAYSNSYIAHGLKKSTEFNEKLEELFNRYQISRDVVFDFNTIAICWQINRKFFKVY